MIVGNRERDCNESSLALALAARMGVDNLESVAGRILFDSVTGRSSSDAHMK